jgi:RNA polymerase sigma-70 factor, ECF subfamily
MSPVSGERQLTALVRAALPKISVFPLPIPASAVRQSAEAVMLEGLRAGQRDAQAALFARYGRMVERLLCRVLGLDPEIPDLVQDVFLAALKGIDRFRGDEGALSTWIGQIAIRTSQLCIRKRQRTRRMQAAVRPPISHTGDAAEDRQLLARTYAVIEQLHEKERLVFVLRFIEQMDVVEVAKLCKISVATVKRRSRRAQDRFWVLVVHDPVLRELSGGEGERR